MTHCHHCLPPKRAASGFAPYLPLPHLPLPCFSACSSLLYTCGSRYSRESVSGPRTPELRRADLEGSCDFQARRIYWSLFLDPWNMSISLSQVSRKSEQTTALPLRTADSVSPWRKKYLISQLIVAKSDLQR